MGIYLLLYNITFSASDISTVQFELEIDQAMIFCPNPTRNIAQTQLHRVLLATLNKIFIASIYAVCFLVQNIYK